MTALHIPKDIEICAEHYAKLNHLPVALVIGVVLTESSARWKATRYEKHYKWLWDPNDGHAWKALSEAQFTSDTPGDEDWDGMQACGTTPEEEWTGQKTSWGPMQLMGAVARELGFAQKFEQLEGPEGIRFGCVHLRNYWRRFHDDHGLEGVISAYNAGHPTDANSEYVDKVKGFMQQYLEANPE